MVRATQEPYYFAESYTVKYAIAPGGPYVDIASGITEGAYVDATVVSGTYYYVVTASANGQESDHSNEVMISVHPVSTEEVSGSMKLTVSPNPVRDILTIDFGRGNLTPKEISVIDVNGRLIMTRKIQEESVCYLNMNGMKAGMYIILISQNGTKQSEKVIKID